MKIKITPNLLSTNTVEATAVVIKNKSGKMPSEPRNQCAVDVPKKITGTVKLRRETKGRGGKAVTILFEFSDTAAQSSLNLKALCTDLKNRLACGGSIEGVTLLLQSEHGLKIQQVLADFGIKATLAGGFSK